MEGTQMKNKKKRNNWKPIWKKHITQMKTIQTNLTTINHENNTETKSNITNNNENTQHNKTRK